MHVDNTVNVHLSRKDTEKTLPNGFHFSEDKRSAYRIIIVEIEGEEHQATFTVHFRGRDPYVYLEKFKDENVNFLINQSISLGLGSKYDKVSTGRENFYAEKKNGKVKKLDIPYFDEKIKNSEDPIKIEIFERNKLILQNIKSSVEEIIPISAKRKVKKEFSETSITPKSQKEIKKKLGDIEEHLKNHYVGGVKLLDLIQEYMKKYPEATQEGVMKYLDELMKDPRYVVRE